MPGIVHVQIEKDQELAFAAYDAFHKDTVAVFSHSAEHLLEPAFRRREVGNVVARVVHHRRPDALGYRP